MRRSRTFVTNPPFAPVCILTIRIPRAFFAHCLSVFGEQDNLVDESGKKQKPTDDQIEREYQDIRHQIDNPIYDSRKESVTPTS